MTNGISQQTRVVALATLMIAGYASTAMAVDPGPGVGKPGVGVGAPGSERRALAWRLASAHPVWA